MRLSVSLRLGKRNTVEETFCDYYTEMPHEIQNLWKVSKAITHIQENLHLKQMWRTLGAMSLLWWYPCTIHSCLHSGLGNLEATSGSQAQGKEWWQEAEALVTVRLSTWADPQLAEFATIHWWGEAVPERQWKVDSFQLKACVSPTLFQSFTSASPVCKSIDCPLCGWISQRYPCPNLGSDDVQGYMTRWHVGC